ncbi:ABC transporter permease [Herbaspirillum rubrisubalbicans]|uniref:ABC transporter permease n=1 Tax=Herbaspirillum rubrisubalbicans TaxID=80842 RepID=UPI0015594D9F|nr:ABC transporter permease [Herbaspirillum rubrisubalbicans]NQE51550.1 ABC transporter [Herbaspirillum rubrisubalbicans]
MPKYLMDIYRFRGFVLGSVKREFASRYRNSMLGALWLILQPLALILVYTLVFANLMQARLPGVDSGFGYSIFLCAGVLTWGMFTEVVTRLQNMFIDNANMLKKVSFPRITLPLIVLINAIIGFAIIFGLFTIFLIVSGNFPGWSFFLILPVLAVQLTLSFGVGMIVGVLNVFFRDVGQLFSILLQFWFWATPIVYPINTLPPVLQKAIHYNPMTALVTSYQNILLYGQRPSLTSLLSVLAISLVLCVLGLRLFRRHAGDMMDEL